MIVLLHRPDRPDVKDAIYPDCTKSDKHCPFPRCIGIEPDEGYHDPCGDDVNPVCVSYNQSFMRDDDCPAVTECLTPYELYEEGHAHKVVWSSL